MAQTGNYLDSKLFLDQVKEQVNRDMLRAAEPIIHKALDEIERKMRKALAANVISLINHNFSVETRGDYLTIQVKQQ